MVESKGFSVKILVDGDEKNILLKDGAVYVPMNSGDEYSILLKNGTDRRADFIVYVDGEMVGKFRLDDGEKINLKRWSDKDKAFVFTRDTSWRALKSGAVPGDEDNGLIRVVFKPEKKKRRIAVKTAGESFWPRRLTTSSGGYTSSPTSWSSPMILGTAPQISSPFGESKKSLGSPAFSSGVTVEGGRTGQKFYDVESLDVDEDAIVEIVLRLVVKEKGDDGRKIRRESYDSQYKYPPPVEPNWER